MPLPILINRRPPTHRTAPHRRRTAGITNDKLSGVTLFSLAAPEALEELFKSIARLLSTAGLDEESPAYFATAAAKAAPLAYPVRDLRVTSRGARRMADLLYSFHTAPHTHLLAWPLLTTDPPQGYDGASILMSLVRDDERRARAFHCCILPPPSCDYGGGGRSVSGSSCSNGSGSGTGGSCSGSGIDDGMS